MAVSEDLTKTPVHVVELSDFDRDVLSRKPFSSVEEANVFIKQQDSESIFEIEGEE
jgi:hypothetical protein